MPLVESLTSGNACPRVKKCVRCVVTVPRHAKSTKYERDTQVIDGLRKHRQRLARDFPPIAASIDALIARFQEHLDAMAEAGEREIAWRVALEREAKLERGIKALMVRVKLLIQAKFGPGGAQLADFGLKPHRRRKPSVETMAKAIERRNATRKLRRTMGRQQRSRIKGGA